MVSPTIRLADRVYHPRLRLALRVVQWIALAVLVAVIAGLELTPKLALRSLWYLFIPLAPMVLLVAPNFWVSVCPVSTIQVLPKRLLRRRAGRASGTLTRNLQLIGWAAMFLGIPTRHLALDFQAAWLFWILLGTAAVVLAVGLAVQGLGGWCTGACPIRPIEMVYGQFALDLNRPEKCNDCGGCVAHCARLKPRTSGGELLREPFARFLCYGLPGFVASFFVVDFVGVWRAEHRFFVDGLGVTPLTWIGVGTIYGFMAAGFALSSVIFWLIRRSGVEDNRLLRVIAVASYCCYYLGVVPEITYVWGPPTWAMPVLWSVPAVVLTVALSQQSRIRIAEAA